MSFVGLVMTGIHTTGQNKGAKVIEQGRFIKAIRYWARAEMVEDWDLNLAKHAQSTPA